MVKVCTFVVCLVFCWSASLTAQTLPEDELQVNFSGYFDSYDVSIIYPNVALTHKVSESTSVTGRYLVDMVSAASIRDSTPQVDVVTSASGRRGGEGPSFDDVRHEIGFGVTQLIPGGTVSMNGIYGTENDYSSATVAGTLTQWFAKKNTSLQLGFVRSWDKVFPLTKDGKRDKNVVSWSANLSQVLSKRLVVQVLGSYATDSGHLSDDYLQIPIQTGQGVVSVDPIHPDRRVGKAAAGRLKYWLTGKSSIQLGYRYYWDTWEMQSQTFSGNYQRYLSSHVILGLGLRSYFQGSAFFFKPEYTEREAFMTKDIKLDKVFSNELQFKLTINGDSDSFVPLFGDDRLQYNLSFNIYQRHSDTPYWFNDSRDLISSTFHAGIRYRF